MRSLPAISAIKMKKISNTSSCSVSLPAKLVAAPSQHRRKQAMLHRSANTGTTVLHRRIDDVSQLHHNTDGSWQCFTAAPTPRGVAPSQHRRPVPASITSPAAQRTATAAARWVGATRLLQPRWRPLLSKKLAVMVVVIAAQRCPLK